MEGKKRERWMRLCVEVADEQDSITHAPLSAPMKSPHMEVMGDRRQTNRAGAPAFPAKLYRIMG